MAPDDPYHAGERQVQALAGKVRQGEAVGRAIAGSIVPGAWDFLAAQSMLVLGSWDGERGAWPSLVFGPPGFASTRNGQSVRLALDSSWLCHQDPLWQNLRGNGLLSMLVIELVTRRRLRINGHVCGPVHSPLVDGHLEISVDQAFANCLRYIQRRTLRLGRARPSAAHIQESQALSGDQAVFIANADTCFVASICQGSGTDVSHRGGHPGFVRVESAARLRIPDYEGNNMFSTLGNIQASGFAGLLFIDFDHGRQLQVVGDAHIDWETAHTAGMRSWVLDIRQVRASSLPSGVEWDFVDASPFNPTAEDG